MKIQKYVNIRDYSTFKIGGQFRYFMKIKKKDDLKNIYLVAKEKNTPIFILGGGSNVIFSDEIIDVLAIKIEIKGFEIIKETNKYVDIKIGAGENWDKIVEKTINMDLSGIEALSAIPGTIGATPIQNVGAYGVEVKDVIVEVEVFDIKNNIINIISNSDCRFGYRDSIFKNEAKGLYIITAVTYRLKKSSVNIPDYQDVKNYFLERNILKPKLKNIREAIIFIRSQKLPNPQKIPNVGSFFKNPIIDEIKAKEIKNKYPNIKIFPVNKKKVKISAGWLIENTGLKGKSFGNISVYEKNALVLINNGQATKNNLIETKNKIIKMVKQKFGIILEQEPEII